MTRFISHSVSLVLLCLLVALFGVSCALEPLEHKPFPGLAVGEPIVSVEQAIGPCDPPGAVCGDDQTAGTCIYCATHAGYGAVLYSACAADVACLSYASCEGACSNSHCVGTSCTDCRAQCQETYPGGWTKYKTLLHRIGCSCQDSCAALGETCP